MDNYKIIIGTTPTITYRFSVVTPSDFDLAILTIKKCGTIIIEKTLSDAEVGENSLSWTLTQEESLMIGISNATMMVNWLTHNGTRGASPEVRVQGIDNHKREVLP